MNFLQQAYKGRTDWWRWLIILVVFVPPFLKDFLKNNIIKPLLPKPFLPSDKNIYIALSLLVYVFLLGVFYLFFKILHKRSFKTLITNRKKFDWLRFGLSFTTWGVFIMILFSLSVFYSPEKFEWNFKLVPFLKYFFICIFLMPVQVFFKAVLMRGYLLQAFTCFFKKTWIALLISILFYSYLMYLGNAEMFKSVGYEILIHYVATAFLIGFIIIIDDGMEIVLGMTLVNNLISSLFVTSKNFTFQPDSILIKDGSINVFILVYVTVFIAYPLYFSLLNKIYKWKNWRQKIFKEIEYTPYNKNKG